MQDFNDNLLDTSDDYILTYIKDHNDTFDFMLLSTYLAIHSHRSELIYNPRPEKITMNDIVKNFKKKIQLNELNCFTKEDDIKKYLGDINYQIIKHSLKNCIYKFKAIQMFSNLMYFNNEKHKNKVDDINLNDFKQYQILLDPIQQEEFEKMSKEQGSCYLFHGSPAENWYSIIRNGLKVLSNTNLQLNGAAYGTGIYLSDDIAFSQNYSRGDCMIIGVFEVIGNRDKYKKNTNIFVVPKENLVRLKYLVSYTFEISSTINIQEMLNTKFRTTIHKQVENHKNNITNIKTRRIINEYNKFKKNEDEYSKTLGFTVNADDSNITIWKITINKFPCEELASEMNKYNIKEMDMEVIFGDEYPMKAPFVRIITPRFNQGTGHVTIGGSLCMEVLCNKWNPQISIECLLVDIIATITNGGGKLHPTMHMHPYTLKEAKESYIQVGKYHGWL